MSNASDTKIATVVGAAAILGSPTMMVNPGRMAFTL